MKSELVPCEKNERVGSTMPGITNILDVGDQIDSYRIDEVLSRSRTSSVFRAKNTTNGQTVALKVPDTEIETDPFLLERFRRAAEIGEKLGHHGVMRVFNEVERSRVYMVMELCNGKTLRQVMNAGKIVPERAIRIATAALEALQYLHDNGVVHRALTPDCIMVNAQDVIKLIDFGQASEAASRRLTFTNLVDELGTVDYISPEQVAGRRCDGRSDIYAMGVILYEMLTGTLPFTGSSPAELMKARLVGPPIPPSVTLPSISLELQEVLYRALERDPRNRYARAHDFAHDLHHLDQIGIENRPELRNWRWKPPRLLRRILFFLLLLLLPCAIVGLMVLLARTK